MNLKELNIIKEASWRPALQRVSVQLEKIDDKSTKGKPSSFEPSESNANEISQPSLKLSPSAVPLEL